MALPTAFVTVEITSLDGLPTATPGAGNVRYARATIQGGTQPASRTGRSRPIPDAGGTFDLSGEPAKWKYEARLDSGNDITIRVELHEDHGDDAPPAVVAFTEKIADPWTPGAVTLGSGPQIKVSVTRELINPTDVAFLARAGIKKGKGGALVVPKGFFVEFESVDGLYKPDPAAVIPNPGSKKVPGYISDDNLGRIFTNRRPDGTWANDTQFIDVAVKITAFGGVTIPAAAQVHWRIEDVDDPTNDAPEFHRDWGPYVDENDYDAAKKPTGAKADDNALAFSPGNADEDKLLGTGVAGNARWATAPGGPAPSAISRSEAKSAITLVDPRNGKSSVRIHCPNVLGTNLVLRAGLDGMPPASRIFPAKTGVMTMWNRIQVEVVRMASAHSMAGALSSIPGFFVPACVQMDFENERSVSSVMRGGVSVSLDIKELSPDEDHQSEKTRDWINDADVFKKQGQGGWFFLGSARFASPLPPPGPAPPPLYDKTDYKFAVDGSNPTVEVKKRVPTATFVRFRWTDGAGKTQNAGFSVWKIKNKVSKSILYLRPNDVTPGFTGHDADGSFDHIRKTQWFYYPQHQKPRSAAALSAGGFGVPSAGARVIVQGPGATFTSGISPSQLVGPANHFAGRTVVFTHTPSFSTGSPPAPKPDFNAEILSTTVHEFLHAFGMPHKCGFWNWRTPRKGASAKSCCMNYFNTWLVDPATNNLLPNTIGKQGDDMCGRHLMEVRRVHLHKNPGLGW